MSSNKFSCGRCLCSLKEASKPHVLAWSSARGYMIYLLCPYDLPHLLVRSTYVDYVLPHVSPEPNSSWSILAYDLPILACDLVHVPCDFDLFVPHASSWSIYETCVVSMLLVDLLYVPHGLSKVLLLVPKFCCLLVFMSSVNDISSVFPQGHVLSWFHVGAWKKNGCTFVSCAFFATMLPIVILGLWNPLHPTYSSLVCSLCFAHSCLVLGLCLVLCFNVCTPSQIWKLFFLAVPCLHDGTSDYVSLSSQLCTCLFCFFVHLSSDLSALRSRDGTPDLQSEVCDDLDTVQIRAGLRGQI